MTHNGWRHHRSINFCGLQAFVQLDLVLEGEKFIRPFNCGSPLIQSCIVNSAFRYTLINESLEPGIAVRVKTHWRNVLSFPGDTFTCVRPHRHVKGISNPKGCQASGWVSVIKPMTFFWFLQEHFILPRWSKRNNQYVVGESRRNIPPLCKREKRIAHLSASLIDWERAVEID